MTQEIVDKLTKENEELKKQIENQKQGVEGLLSQLDASKQMFNESANTGLQVRTGFVMTQKVLKVAQDDLAHANKKIEKLAGRVTDLTNQVAVLEEEKKALSCCPDILEAA